MLGKRFQCGTQLLATRADSSQPTREIVETDLAAGMLPHICKKSRDRFRLAQPSKANSAWT